MAGDIAKSESRRREAGIESHSRPRALAVRAGSWLLIAVLFIALFWEGGVQPQTLAILFGLSALAWSFAWANRPHRSPIAQIAWLWVALGLYTALLLVPLPRGIVALLHPHALQLSDAGRAALDLEPLSFLPLALAWGETAFQASLYFLAGAFGLLTANLLTRPGWRIETRQFARLLVWPVLANGVLWFFVTQPLAVFLVPHGVSEFLSTFVFVNPNHQAAVMVVGFALALGGAIDARNYRVRGLYGMAAIGLGLVVLLTASRGGILAGVFAIVLTGLTAPRPNPHMRQEERKLRAQKRERTLLGSLSIVIILVVLTLPILEPEFQISEGASLFDDNKLILMSQSFGLIGHGWLFGQGPGALPVDMAELFPKIVQRVDFAENLIADRLLSGGILGGLTFLLALGWIVRPMLGLKRRQAGYTPLWIAMSALLLHELMDFSMEIAGGLLLFMALATMAERLGPRKKVRSRQRARRSSWQRLLPGQIGAAFSLGLGALLLVQSHGLIHRQINDALVDLDVESTAQRVAGGLMHDHHAWYLLGRKQMEAKASRKASLALDRAIALRPASMDARLFRFAVRNQTGDLKGAQDDLQKLLMGPRPIFERAMKVCMDSGHAASLLTVVIPRVPHLSYDVGHYLFKRRPALLERVALGLREAFPDQRLAIESLRARLYLQRGLLEPARRISAVLMANPKTELAGWELEASIQRRTGHPYEAFQLYKEVCERWPGNEEACLGAIDTILKAKRPKQALAYIRSCFPKMRSTPTWAAHYWRAMARVYLQLDHADDAIMAAERVLGFKRNDRVARKLLVLARLRVGDRRRAAELLGKLRQEDPDDHDLVSLSAQVSASGRD